LRNRRIEQARRTGPATLAAKIRSHVTIEAHPDGEIRASVFGHSIGLGKLGAAVANRAHELRTGLSLDSFAPDIQSIDKEVRLLVRRLARHGLIEYRLRAPRSGQDLVIIEPQVPDYWPRMAPLDDTDSLVLSRFVYMRRRGNDTVLESPRAGALFKICNPKIATTLARLSTPQQVKRLSRQDAFPSVELLALLVDCQILFKPKTASDSGLRSTEGDESLVLWDFHDLLFHARSTEGRHANPLGGVYSHARTVSPLPAVRPPWPGEKIALGKFSAAQPDPISLVASLLRQRHSTRNFDDQRPITLEELSRFLDSTAAVASEVTSRFELGEDGPSVTYALRPYPSAGASYELELYLAVDKCEGLARGFYYYDAGEHALVPIKVRESELDALLMRAAFAMGAPAAPQILITIAARFGRVSWKYSSIAYSLILKDVGALMQSFYLMATDMGLGGCAIGIANIDLFAMMTGIEFYIEGPVGQFAIGRGVEPGGPPPST
jgi:SagB-type dehydrogenase family enzyme